jgi:hypothetical protein
MSAQKLKRISYAFLGLGIATFLYIIVHETGHLIVMLSAGATITDFSIMFSHVSAVGGKYTDGSEMWLNANGAVLPVVVAYTAMFFYNKKHETPFYRIIYFLVTSVPIGSLLAWVIIPLLYMAGKAPANDDVTKFLDTFTKYYPAYVTSIIAALLMGVGVYLTVSLGLLGGYAAEIKHINDDTQNKNGV